MSFGLSLCYSLHNRSALVSVRTFASALWLQAVPFIFKGIKSHEAVVAWEKCLHDESGVTNNMDED